MDLLQFAARLMTEPGTRSPEVVWREFRYTQPFRVFLHDVPDDFLRDRRSPNNTFAAKASEDLTVRDFGNSRPVIDRLLHPIGHRNRANVPSFPNEVNYGPMIFAALNMVKGQINEFSSTEPTPRRTARMARSLLPFTLCMFGSCHKERASSTVNQFPSRMPSFFAPFTRRMPAASSGLRSPVSAAS